MMRKCHLNTCPVGVATQDPELRKRFTGEPEHVVNFMSFIAEEVREIMAGLGFRTIDEMIGRADRLEMRARRRSLEGEGSRLLPHLPPARRRAGGGAAQLRGAGPRPGGRARPPPDRPAPPALTSAGRCASKRRCTTPTGSSAPCCRARWRTRYGHEGLPDDTIWIKCTGTAGQSFGAFLARGITLELEGDANDYVGKGLSGGRLIVYPSQASQFDPHENIIIGNTVLYGAIAGEAYFRGVAGERFAVRNSGVLAVVEGVGDHGCEYMTGGCVVVIGSTGRNFAAGMTGGIAYVLDEDGCFAQRCNLAMVELQPIADEDEQLEEMYHQGGDLEATAGSS